MTDDLDAKRGYLLPDARFNADRTRFCLPTREGIACYSGTRDEKGNWKGTVVGLVDTDDDAQRFLDGMLVSLRRRDH